ncbi:hypothetical protein [Streptomyces chartreusis]|uniref:hypothetical protein n=1 Tax=Streptomyces chartreusis TaxID=1969 RepID=UPI003866E74F|nr:hypothetical protein OG938_37300 [Streptomyces chartreusis]
MDAPVFVIHGVANRDRDSFVNAVASLKAASGVEMVPVYWGDLGAEDRFINLTLPPAAAGRIEVTGIELRDRGEAGPDQVDTSVLLSVLAAPTDRRGQWNTLEAAVRARLTEDAEVSSFDLRDGDAERPDPDEVLEYLEEEWPETQWLCRTDDARLLLETGRSLAEALIDSADLNDGHEELREGAGKGRGLRALVRRRLQDLDRVVGAAIQATAGRINHALRTGFGPGTTRFLGDVLVYQRHQDAIHARVQETIAAVDPALGRTPDRPVRIVAHSLGGVIAVDMATATHPLWTSSLLTFGSQPAFFHACDPRGGQLTPYAGDGAVVLPESLRRWTNLWEPLDLLAFIASTLFRLHDGTPPDDIPVSHTASSGLWTHSAYWENPDVAAAINTAMNTP